MSKKSTVNARLKMPTLNQIKDINDLRSRGTYTEVKIGIEEKIGVSLKANGWNQLFNKIKSVSISINNNIDQLIPLFSDEGRLKETGQFSEAKKIISELLSLQIKARGWEELRYKLKTIVSAFNDCIAVDKYELFERNKIKNFISSSKLEGIQITENLTSRNMADVLNKYRSTR